MGSSPDTDIDPHRLSKPFYLLNQSSPPPPQKKKKKKNQNLLLDSNKKNYRKLVRLMSSLFTSTKKIKKYSNQQADDADA